MKIKQLQERRNKAAGKILEFRDKFHQNGKKWADDAERSAWKSANDELAAADSALAEARETRSVEKRFAEVEERNRRSANRRGGVPGREDGRPRDVRSRGGDGRRREDRGGDRPNGRGTGQLAIRAWFKRQSGVELTREEREACRRTGLNPNKRNLDLRLEPTSEYEVRQAEFRDRHPSMHLRALGTGGGSAGATIPKGFIPRLEDAMLAFGGMLQVAQVMTTDSGNELPHPTANDTANEGEIVGESATIGNSVDPTFGSVSLKAFKFSSKLVKVSTEIMEDTAFDLNRYLSRKLGERIGRAMNRKFTVGAGTTEPWGIVTRAALGVTCASATAITADEVIRLEHAVDPSYRSGDGVGYMMHDQVLLAVRLLKDSTGQYIWRPGLAEGRPDRLNGYRVQINQHMASALAAAAKTMLFGDLSKYLVRRVRTVRLRRLVERYADTDEEGFIGFVRADGDLIDAGTSPVKYLRQL